MKTSHVVIGFLALLASVLGMGAMYLGAVKKTVHVESIWLPSKHTVRVISSNEANPIDRIMRLEPLNMGDFKRLARYCPAATIAVVINRQTISYTLPDECLHITAIQALHHVQVSPRNHVYVIDDARAITYAHPGAVVYPVKLNFWRWFFEAVVPAGFIPGAIVIALGCLVLGPRSRKDDGERFEENI